MYLIQWEGGEEKKGYYDQGNREKNRKCPCKLLF